jgi:flagellar basal-body rod modification protein FlgD
MAEVKPFDLTTRNMEPAKAPTFGSSALGKDQFLKLMLEQMKNQDPTKPMDNQAMVAQLAQFSTLELMQNTNKTLDMMLMGQAANQQTQMVSMVGKDVTYMSDKMNLLEGQSATVMAGLTVPADNVTAVIKDSAGAVVRTIQLGSHAAGQLPVTWDGRNDNGVPMASGSYSVTVTAADANGNALNVSQRATGQVTGISFENGIPELLVGTVRIGVSDVVEIKERSTQ